VRERKARKCREGLIRNVNQQQILVEVRGKVGFQKGKLKKRRGKTASWRIKAKPYLGTEKKTFDEKEARHTKNRAPTTTEHVLAVGENGARTRAQQKKWSFHAEGEIREGF